MTPREYAAMRSDLIETARNVLTERIKTECTSTDALRRTVREWADLIVFTTRFDEDYYALREEVINDIEIGVIA